MGQGHAISRDKDIDNVGKKNYFFKLAYTKESSS